MTSASSWPEPPVHTEVRPPGRHLGLHWRAPGGQDRDALARMVAQVMRTDRLVRLLGERDVELMTSHPAVTALIGLDLTGQPRAVAAVAGQDGQYLGVGMVEPGLRDNGIGRALLSWQLSAFRALARHDEVPACLHAVVDDAHVSRRRLHAAAGFSQSRSLLLMSRELQADARSAPEPLPEGLSLRSFALPDGSWDTALLEELRRARRRLVGTRDAGPLSLSGVSVSTLQAALCAHTSLAALDEDGRVIGGILTSDPINAPHLASPLMAPQDVVGWTQADSELLAPGSGPVAHALLVATRRTLRDAGVGAHLVPVDVASPLRASVQELGYAVVGTQTRSSFTL